SPRLHRERCLSALLALCTSPPCRRVELRRRARSLRGKSYISRAKSLARCAQEITSHVRDVPRRKPVLLEECLVRSGFPVDVHQAVPPESGRSMLAEDLGHGATQASDDRVLLRRHYEASLLGGSHDSLGV